MFFSVKEKIENPKLLQIRRGKVSEAFNWLVLNNLLYKDVVIDESRLDSLPENGIIEVKTKVLPIMTGLKIIEKK